MESKNLSSKWVPHISVNFATRPSLIQKINLKHKNKFETSPTPELTMSEGENRGNIES